eukprot:SAG31_NODE_41495_length_276_cov_0.338983_1_plen_26_part_10
MELKFSPKFTGFITFKYFLKTSIICI